MLTPEELKQIDDIVEKRRNPNYHLGGLNLSVIIQTLIVAGIVGLYVKIDQNTTTSIKRGVEMGHVIKDIGDVKSTLIINRNKIDNFTAEPRYTRKDALEDFTPILKQLDRIEADLWKVKNEHAREN